MEQAKVLIVFYSRNGNTEKLAEAMAEGARAEGAEVTLRRVNEIVSEEIIGNVPGWKENRHPLRSQFRLRGRQQNAAHRRRSDGRAASGETGGASRTKAKR